MRQETPSPVPAGPNGHHEVEEQEPAYAQSSPKVVHEYVQRPTQNMDDGEEEEEKDWD